MNAVIIKAAGASAVSAFSIVSILLFSFNVLGNKDLNAIVSDYVQANKRWILTVYYTPVEEYHPGTDITVQSCLDWACEQGLVEVGNYSKEFIDLVQLEGVGRLTNGQYAGNYLHYSSDKGYWLTNEPLDAIGNQLIPFQTAAAHSVVSTGKRFIITKCGSGISSRIEISSDVCKTLKSTTWKVNDRFDGDIEENHIDLYIGEEDRENYLKTNPYIIAVEDAHIKFIN